MSSSGAVEHWWNVDRAKMIPCNYEGIAGVAGASAHPAEQHTAQPKSHWC